MALSLIICGSAAAARPPGEAKIEHVVVTMLENRSFDSMLGWLYKPGTELRAPGTAAGRATFEGLTGKESNRVVNADGSSRTYRVWRIKKDSFKGPEGVARPYKLPGVDPWEGAEAANWQIFGCSGSRYQCSPQYRVDGRPSVYYDDLEPGKQPKASMGGYASNWAQWLRNGYFSEENTGRAGPGAIMGAYDPSMLPVMSKLARRYAVADRWFSSVPTETAPNRGFAYAGTSLGKMGDSVPWCWQAKSIFQSIDEAGKRWKAYGTPNEPLLITSYPYLLNLAEGSEASRYFGGFHDFLAEAKAGRLPNFAYVEPSWGTYTSQFDNVNVGTDQHPVEDVAEGEEFLLDIYRALRASPDWDSTLWIVYFDESGGLYDHVPPPATAPAPDWHTDLNTETQFFLSKGSNGETEQNFSEAAERDRYTGFEFDRYGPRVPAILVSPYIEPHTLLRTDAADAARGRQIDHTSLLSTLEKWWGMKQLTRRDRLAPTIGQVLTRSAPRQDHPLAKVRAPKPSPPLPAPPSERKEVAAQISESRRYVLDRSDGDLQQITGEYLNFPGGEEPAEAALPQPAFGPSWKPSCVSPKAFDTIAAAKRRLAQEK
ncbi:MAG: alkaline phosphatase family protein [Solirubrobacterales bacterium]